MSNNALRGTAAELIARGLTVNGVKVDQTAFSVMSRLGMFKNVGEGPKATRGKAPTIWQVPETIDASLSVVVTNGDTASA